MKPTFRNSTNGQIVFLALSHWVVARLTKSGLTLPEWAAKGYQLTAIGISKQTAIRELKPQIPLAHEWYNQHGDSRTRGPFPTWESYWPVLHNRIHYFFHKHNDAGRGSLVPCIAEWPGTISTDGLALVPPPVPYDGPEIDRLEEGLTETE